MRPVKDIKGQKFGMLTAEKHEGHSVWTFRCDCGGTKTVKKYNVTAGQTLSCGCLLTNQTPVREGHVIGRLTAVHKVDVTYFSNMWCWACHCGKEFDAKINEVRAGVVASCGCSAKEPRPVMQRVFFDGMSIADIARTAGLSSMDTLKYILKYNEVPT